MINPSEEQLAALINYPEGKPFVMVNLLKFKEKGSHDGETGRDAYNRYAMVMMSFLKRFDARPLWVGDVGMSFIGTEDETWDEVILVEYPSREAFLSMISSPEYKDHNINREAGLERMALVLCEQKFPVEA